MNEYDMALELNSRDECCLPLQLEMYVDSDHESSIFLGEESPMNCSSYPGRSTPPNSVEQQHQWPCPSCPLSFPTVFYLREHLRSHEENLRNSSVREMLGSGRHRCAECEKSYLSFTELEDHMNTHLIPPSHHCKECGKSFHLAESLDVHLCSHLRFTNASSSTSMSSPASKNVKIHTCPVCSKSFRNASYFHLHVRNHAGDKSYTCQLCEKSFSCSWNLKTHLAVHRDEKPFVCSVCGVCFKLKANMQRHERSHLLNDMTSTPSRTSDGSQEIGRKPYSCSTCGMQFKVKANMNRHERLHTENNNKPVSSSQLNSPQVNAKNQQNLQLSLNDVTRTQSNDVNVNSVSTITSLVNDRRHMCKVCGKAYKQRCHLLSHILSHSEARPYVCNLCGKSFSLAWNLKTHLAVHNQEKPFACALCGSTFKLKTALQRHERSHTSNKIQGEDGFGVKNSNEQHRGNGGTNVISREIKCPGCEKKFCTFRELHGHMHVHNEPDLITCHVCGQEFEHVESLRSHLETCKCSELNVKTFSCCVCEKRFSSSVELQIHKQMHS